MRTGWIAGLLVLATPLACKDWVVGLNAARWRETILGRAIPSDYPGLRERTTPHYRGYREFSYSSNLKLPQLKPADRSIHRSSAYIFLVNLGLSTRQAFPAPFSGKNLTILPLGGVSQIYSSSPRSSTNNRRFYHERLPKHQRQRLSP